MEKSADQCTNGKVMAPKNNYDPTNSATKSNADEADIQEMVEVNNNLDQLTRALDFFEQRTDSIIAQLKDLLHSNREIRQQMALEQEAALSAAIARGGEIAPDIKDPVVLEEDINSMQ